MYLCSRIWINGARDKLITKDGEDNNLILMGLISNINKLLYLTKIYICLIEDGIAINEDEWRADESLKLFALILPILLPIYWEK